ncbi:MAG: ferredoxin [Promethearchaeota archaeon CR_4]|nr:MAG: ferredoxin [Candidatus Lokiarchaeota archaeon CR_4]
MPQIIFEPISKRLDVVEGISVYDAARQLGNVITSLCGGKRKCGKCKIQITKYKKPLPPLSPEENKLLSRSDLEKGIRLACCMLVNGDMRIFIPEESRVKSGRILEDGASIEVKLLPAVQKQLITVKKPRLENIESDIQRFLDQCPTGTQFSLDILQQLPRILREGDHQITVTRLDSKVLHIQPGDQTQHFYGLAVDIGTTTVVGYLINLRTGQIIAIHSFLNPQTAHGEDVVTRLDFAAKNDGLKKLQTLIIDGINSIIHHTCDKAGIDPQNLAEITIVGNTAMHHLFLGLDARYLALAPFPPVVQQSLDVPAKDLKLNVPSGCNVHLLPNIAGYVGADTCGVILAAALEQQEKFTLTIDIGTNGELVLGDKHLLVAGSCAAGSALEGAQIGAGMRAAPGAIERVRIDPETLAVEYTTIEGEPPIGICGSGIIDLIAELLRAKILTRSGRFNFKLTTAVERGLLRPQNGDWEFVLTPKAYTGISRDIIITQEDVRQVQLAKGAFYAGSILLLNNLSRSPADIQQLNLAGAFGSYIDKKNARFIGMIPDVELGKIFQIGNAAGVGSRYALINREMRERIDTVAHHVRYVELTTRPEFASEYARAMYFPHLDVKQRFPSLENDFLTIPKRVV